MTPAEQFTAAFRDGRNVFLTGQAGTGKSWLLRESITMAPFHVDVTAPTGVAALNIDGRTVHRWSGMLLGPGEGQDDLHYMKWLEDQPYPSIRSGWKRVKTCKCLVIDEISMMCGRQLTFLEYMFRYLRKDQRPWGGCQLVVTGDFLQLPPVRTDDRKPYDWCFTTPAWAAAQFETILLTKVMRQDEPDFVAALGAMRLGDISGASADLLNRCVVTHPDADIPRLLTHNAQVDNWNRLMLSDLPGEPMVYEAQRTGNPKAVEFLEKNLLCPMRLELKPGARVMFTVNDRCNRFVNGSIGEILRCDASGPSVSLRGGVVDVELRQWTSGDEGHGQGIVRQYPLRLAYAMTIHKAQGITLASAYVDIRAAREAGQSYVAISRVKTADGLKLKAFPNWIAVSEEAIKFYKQPQKL